MKSCKVKLLLKQILLAALVMEHPNQVEARATTGPSKVRLTEEQEARVEADRQKALERAAARARFSQASSMLCQEVGSVVSRMPLWFLSFTGVVLMVNC